MHFDQVRFDENFEAICNKAKGIQTEREITIKHWSDADSIILKELYFSGKRIDEMAVQMHRETTTIWRKIRELALPARKKPKRKPDVEITDELRQMIFDMWKQFCSVVEISGKTNVSIRRVHWIIKEGQKKSFT